MALKILVLMTIFKLALLMPDPKLNVIVNVNVQDNENCLDCINCVFGDQSFPNGDMNDDTCLELQCTNGKWNYTGEISNKCGECQVWGDPHIMTFENHTVQDPYGSYDFQGMGTYVITQDGHQNNSLFGLNSTFVPCADGNVSCVISATYYEPGMVVRIQLPAAENNCTHSTDNDCLIKVYVNDEEREIGRSVKSFSGLDGNILVFEHSHIASDDVECINIVGSVGLSVSLCLHLSGYTYLNVWAFPLLHNDLYGLCDVFTGEEVDGYTERDGSLTNHTDIFGGSWGGDDSVVVRSSVNLRKTKREGKCKDEDVYSKMKAKCKKSTKKVCAKSEHKCSIKKKACVHDLCKVDDDEGYGDGAGANSDHDSKPKKHKKCSWLAHHKAVSKCNKKKKKCKDGKLLCIHKFFDCWHKKCPLWKSDSD